MLDFYVGSDEEEAADRGEWTTALEEALHQLQKKEPEPVRLKLRPSSQKDILRLAEALTPQIAALHLHNYQELRDTFRRILRDDSDDEEDPPRMGTFELTTLGALVDALVKNSARLKNFELSNLEVGAHGPGLLATLFPCLPVLASIVLAGIGVKPDGIEVMANALHGHPSLTRLELYCELGTQGAEAIARLLSATSLRVLSLAECGLTSSDLQVLMDSLKDNTSVTRLCLAGNRLEDRGAMLIAQMLQQNSTLARLSLMRTDIRQSGFSSVVAALQHNTGLQWLELSGNKLLALPSFSLNFTLTNLGLSHCNLRERGAAVAEALSRNPGLLRLDLEWNELPDGTVKKVAKALEVNTHLQMLSLASNKVGLGGAAALGKALSRNVTLTKLDLTSTELGPSGLRGLLPGLCANTSLQDLDLCNNSLGAMGAPLLAELVATNDGLSTLLLSDNDLGLPGRTQIVEALEDNLRITKLDFSFHNLGGAAGPPELQDRAKVCLERNQQPALVLSLKAEVLEHQLQVTCSTLGGTSFRLVLPSNAGAGELRRAAMSDVGLGPLAQGRPIFFVLPNGCRLGKQPIAAALGLSLVRPPCASGSTRPGAKPIEKSSSSLEAAVSRKRALPAEVAASLEIAKTGKRSRLLERATESSPAGPKSSPPLKESSKPMVSAAPPPQPPASGATGSCQAGPGHAKSGPPLKESSKSTVSATPQSQPRASGGSQAGPCYAKSGPLRKQSRRPEISATQQPAAPQPGPLHAKSRPLTAELRQSRKPPVSAPQTQVLKRPASKV